MARKQRKLELNLTLKPWTMRSQENIKSKPVGWSFLQSQWPGDNRARIADQVILSYQDERTRVGKSHKMYEELYSNPGE